MKTVNVFKDDKFLKACDTMFEAQNFVKKDAGSATAEWALRYQGYQIKHGVKPKGGKP